MNANTDNIVFGGEVDSDIIPDDDGTFDLGSASKEWQDIFIDGTAKIDTLTVDENATVAGTLGVTGVVTANAGVVVDTMTLDGSTLSSTGGLILDLASNLTIDVDGTTITLADGGVNFGQFYNNASGTFNIVSPTQDKDIVFRGNDGGSGIVALTLDISNAGAATFNSSVTAGSFIQADGNISTGSNSGKLRAGLLNQVELSHNGSHGELDVDTGNLTVDVAGDIALDAGGSDIQFLAGGTEFGRVFGSSDNFYIQARQSDKDMIFQGIDGGSTISALTFDMSAAGAATFNSSATFGGGITVAGIGGLSNVANDLTIFSSTSGHNGLRFHADGILPTDNAGAIVDADADLGIESHRFKDLFLSGIASAGGIITPTAGTSNFVAGVNAGNSIISGGNYNTVIGDEAGTAITNGDENTFVGFQSGDGTTSAVKNTAIGAYSLGDNTTGDNNTAVGRQALKFNTTASNNTAVGYHALQVNTTGTQNVALGANALDANTAGNNNTAIGLNSLKANTTGGQNVAVGDNALATNTTATYNTALGTSTLQLNTTGAQNVATGGFALTANTTGNNNVAMGYQALKSNTTASNNTAIGDQALELNTTGTRNIAIGALAYDAADTENDNLGIGYAALGGAVAGGEKNVAIGNYSLDALTSGDANVAIGYNAGSAVTTGSNNTVLGYQAALSLTTAQDVVAIGRDAGAALTEGNYNTLVGRDAGNDITTGTHNNFIGAYSGDGHDTETHNLGVGYAALGGAVAGGEYNIASR